jgi:hypothetical protein
VAEATAETVEPVSETVAEDEAVTVESPAEVAAMVEAEPLADEGATEPIVDEVVADAAPVDEAAVAAEPTTEGEETVEPEAPVETTMPDTIQSEEELLAVEIGELAIETDAVVPGADESAVTELEADMVAVADEPQVEEPVAGEEVADSATSVEAEPVEQSDQLISESTSERAMATDVAPDVSDVAAAVEPEDSAAEGAESIEGSDELIAETIAPQAQTTEFLDEQGEPVIETDASVDAAKQTEELEPQAPETADLEFAESGVEESSAAHDAAEPLVDVAAVEETPEPQVTAAEEATEPVQETVSVESAPFIEEGAADAPTGGRSSTTYFADSKSGSSGKTTNEPPRPTAAPVDLELSTHLRGEVAFLRQQSREKDRQIGVWGEGAKWLQPFVDQIRSLEKQVERLGDLQVQRDNERIADLVSERDSLRERLATLEERINAAQSAAPAPLAIHRRSWFQRMMGSE